MWKRRRSLISYHSVLIFLDLWDATGGCAGLLLASLLKCDSHLRKELASCVILTGGGACISGNNSIDTNAKVLFL